MSDLMELEQWALGGRCEGGGETSARQKERPSNDPPSPEGFVR
jgi:hypothetical protein